MKKSIVIHRNQPSTLAHTVYVVLLAAGAGKRLGKNIAKAFVKLKGKPIFQYAAETLLSHEYVKEMVIVFPPGGATRQDSVKKGLESLENDHNLKRNDLVLIHNAANPFVTKNEITEAIKAAKKHRASAVGYPVSDTIKVVSKTRKVVKTLNRDMLWAMQTPQVIEYSLLKRGLSRAQKQKINVTDDISLVELLGIKPKIIPASPHNRKITTYEDLRLAQTFLGDIPRIHTGIGEDSHCFDRTHRGLSLGGVKFKRHPKLKANSDGDVILHALYNAIAEAVGEKSLGSYADELYAQKNITDSTIYLKQILACMTQKGYSLSHIGISIEAQSPQIDPIADKIKQSLSRLTMLASDHIGITAHSGEELTPFGRGEAMKATAIVTIHSAMEV